MKDVRRLWWVRLPCSSALTLTHTLKGRLFLSSLNGDEHAIWVIVPVGQQSTGRWIDDVLRNRADEKVDALSAVENVVPHQRVEVVRDRHPESAISEIFYARGWTDGLPIVAPTITRVRQMVRFSCESAYTVVGELGPLNGQATVEKIAANAVMAGCMPEYFPVVLAAIKGLSDPQFNLRGVQMTDENVTPLIIVSGPLSRTLGINCSIGALGPGWRANATIGRAIRLIMNNIGGGWPAITSLAGIGQPARYTLCVAENNTASPWPPLHTESGVGPEESAVTLLRAEAVINITGELDDVASVMGSAVSAFSVLHGGKVCVLLSPATARRLSNDGWSKHQIADYLYEHARIPLDVWQKLWIKRRIAQTYPLPNWVKQAEQEGRPIPIVETLDDIIIFVAGGDAPISQHVYFPTWGFPSCRIVVRIEFPPGLRSLIDRTATISHQ